MATSYFSQQQGIPIPAAEPKAVKKRTFDEAPKMLNPDVGNVGGQNTPQIGFKDAVPKIQQTPREAIPNRWDLSNKGQMPQTGTPQQKQGWDLSNKGWMPQTGTPQQKQGWDLSNKGWMPQTGTPQQKQGSPMPHGPAVPGVANAMAQGRQVLAKPQFQPFSLSKGGGQTPDAMKNAIMSATGGVGDLAQANAASGAAGSRIPQSGSATQDTYADLIRNMTGAAGPNPDVYAYPLYYGSDNSSKENGGGGSATSDPTKQAAHDSKSGQHQTVIVDSTTGKDPYGKSYHPATQEEMDEFNKEQQNEGVVIDLSSGESVVHGTGDTQRMFVDSPPTEKDAPLVGENEAKIKGQEMMTDFGIGEALGTLNSTEWDNMYDQQAQQMKNQAALSQSQMEADLAARGLGSSGMFVQGTNEVQGNLRSQLGDLGVKIETQKIDTAIQKLQNLLAFKGKEMDDQTKRDLANQVAELEQQKLNLQSDQQEYQQQQDTLGAVQTFMANLVEYFGYDENQVGNIMRATIARMNEAGVPITSENLWNYFLSNMAGNWE